MDDGIKRRLFDEILREYDFIRQKNKKEVDKRKNDLYEKNHELKDLERKINELDIEIARMVLNINGKENVILELKEKKRDLIEKYKSVLKNLGVDKNYFEVYDCKICRDTGFVDNKKCDCFKKKLAKRYCDISGLEEIFEKENFETFDFSFYKNMGEESFNLIKNVYKASLNFVEGFGVKFNNLLFCGDTGLGKTFLCNCIAKEILAKGKMIVYKTAPELFSILEEIRFNSCEENKEKEKMIFGCDLLIIDDLGSEFKTKPTHSDLFNIINMRLVKRKPVIISSNLKSDALQDFYTKRIASRIYGNYNIYEFVGEDIRIKKRLV